MLSNITQKLNQNSQLLSCLFSNTKSLPKIGLSIKEPLLFEQDRENVKGVDLEDFEEPKENLLKGLTRNKIGLPSLSENQVVRHYLRLSQKNYGIDTGIYPLGSCTMKYNPRINEVVARIPKFVNSHPFQPEQTIQGSLEILHTLAECLLAITGMKAVTLSPAAGAHGELCGIMAISQAMFKTGEKDRKIILVPDAAHGTNPATTAMCGFKVREIKTTDKGIVDIEDLKRNLKPDVAGMMLTNPNTCGIFEKDIIQISDLLHKNGSYFYMDGANLNALLGRASIEKMGVDAMHINLHKTFSTPHGGGGPGSGPVVFSERLAKYAPLPYVIKQGDSFKVIEKDSDNNSLGRVKAYFGQSGVIARALAYILSFGNGLVSVGGDAVLNANYIRKRLESVFSPAFPGQTCMHEVVFSDKFLKGTGVTTLDIAKAMIDSGLHPMTMYFPLVVHGAMLMEPTESESIETLDEYCDAMLNLAKHALSGKAAEEFQQAPQATPVKRLNESLAARNPILRFKPKKK
ncbi:glycine dehydrogenase decarboxylating [Anaeramoeba ignava]|uniref:glycine dehydrogenase (aminomethyl-transferring) n=1 Tax=Anaeramoeba ignava TaxID=1746090 RepID=A0A9Q0L6K0_ANAIG|nr:glycine dehydrogenase decarboxylating [Anaeramoeba ignava]|eukprot:Anaeramoba_ignava/a608976_327.p1 GENE.a608976_327~~a608976_327.p1  ORF type:complete len:517 (-),score=171.95 a608976_327:146-1696(-)